MRKRAWLILVLLAVVALPFALRTRRTTRSSGGEVLVIITPHNEAIRSEFGRAFPAWFRARTGRDVRVDWRVIGGTSDIARFLESSYAAAFEYAWTKRDHHEWSASIEAGFQNARLAADAPAEVRAAREAFLRSEVSAGIDLFFGGDAYQAQKEAAAGHFVDSEVERRHPDWFRDDLMPLSFAGEPFRDREWRWFGVVLSSYGILYNRVAYRRLGLEAPKQWMDLADPRLRGELGLADPTKSGSVCEAFENIIQQQMHRTAAAGGDPAQAASDGWTAGLQLIQRLGANARYFTDSSQKPPIDVANGDCAAGLCIDFYGRQQQEAVRRRGDAERIGFSSPVGGSAVSTDPIGMLRGAPHRELATAFIEFVLSTEGQKLWAFRPGVAGGPEQFALRRTPIRRDFYAHREWAASRSDPDDNPYAAAEAFVYRPDWTGSLFREIGFVTRVMCQDTHTELVDAWRAIAAAPEPRRQRALAILQDVSRIDYDRVRGEIHRRLNAVDRVEEVRLATELTGWFRANYERARRVADGGE